MSLGNGQDADEFLAALKNSRKSPAVLKIRLANLRSVFPDALVFAFEGDDDKTIYAQWIKRCQPDLSYEPFPCRGKKQVLMLKKLLDRDLGGLNRNMFYFVDRDFDGYAGFSEHPTIFMTDRFSVENYLVDRNVLSDLLKNEFHCDAAPKACMNVLSLFESQYDKFLLTTAGLNRKIHLGVQTKVGFLSHFPDSVGAIVDLTLLDVKPNSTPAEDLIVLQTIPESVKATEANRRFDTMEPRKHYRGKFALLFFIKWLELVAQERKNDAENVFPDADRSRSPRTGEITLSNLASRAPLPFGFREFLSEIVAPRKNIHVMQ